MSQQKLIMFLLVLVLFASRAYSAEPKLIAIGAVSGLYEDFATETSSPLENESPGNRLGGIGSGIAYAGGSTFLALPDRGPNAIAYNGAVDNTTSYIPRFHYFSLSLAPSDPGSALPFTLTPMLLDTTLLSSPSPLYYGSGSGLGLASGSPGIKCRRSHELLHGPLRQFRPPSAIDESRRRPF